MKLLELLPELEEGGVERHVVALASALSARGHEVRVVSRGGKLQSALPARVSHQRLPLDRKNPAVILHCAWQIAAMVRREGFELIHTHSRVPAWIGYLASQIAGVPLVVSAHFLAGNRTRWIYRPYRRAARVICVSRTVEECMAPCFSGNTVVVRNGLAPPAVRWRGPRMPGERHLLFIGRLTRSKGLQDVLGALVALKDAGNWRLDILGDGTMREELDQLVRTGGLQDRVTFHGFSEDTDRFLERCSCLLFPSHHEGMPLTLARAIQMETPVIASDIPSVRELCSNNAGLVPPGDSQRWREALVGFLSTGRVPGEFSPAVVPTLEEMTMAIEEVYSQVIGRHSRGKSA